MNMKHNYTLTLLAFHSVAITDMGVSGSSLLIESTDSIIISGHSMITSCMLLILSNLDDSSAHKINISGFAWSTL